MIGLEAAGAHQVVVDSINKADLDLRKNLFSNVVLSGGSTLCKGSPVGWHQYAGSATDALDFLPQGMVIAC